MFSFKEEKESYAMNLKELCGVMGKFAHGVFATIDENGYPDMRGWEFQFEKDGKLYFTTSSVKSVYRQMLANPRVAYLCDAGDYHIRHQRHGRDGRGCGRAGSDLSHHGSRIV